MLKSMPARKANLSCDPSILTTMATKYTPMTRQNTLINGFIVIQLIHNQLLSYWF